MTFDAPLLLFLAPLVALAVGFARLARPAAAGSGWRGGGRPRWARSRDPAAAGLRLVLGLGGLLAALAWPGRAAGRTRGQDRDPGA